MSEDAVGVRYRLVRQFFKDDPLVAVYAISDDELGIAGRTDQWMVWYREFMEKVVAGNNGGCDVSEDALTFYVGEPEYAEDIRKSSLKVKLMDRTINEARATIIRQEPLKCWDQIAQSYRGLLSHNILITGTASEGKTTLTEDIGRYFNLPYSHEWAKEYVAQLSLGDWEFDCTDFLTFLNGQFNLNRACRESSANNGIFVSDTDVLVTKMYAEYYAATGCMGISTDEYMKVIAPAADEYAKRENWDKVFVLVPHGEFADDHIRYMGHSSMDARTDMINILLRELELAGHGDKIEVLNGGYLENFERVKAYIKEVTA